MIKAISQYAIGIFLLLAAVSADAKPGRFRTIHLNEMKSEKILVKHGRVTVLSFQEPIKERWNPLPKAFMDYTSAIREDLLILPAVDRGETNFVVISGNSRFHFTLVVVDEATAHDEVVVVKRVYEDRQSQHNGKNKGTRG